MSCFNFSAATVSPLADIMEGERGPLDLNVSICSRNTREKIVFVEGSNLLQGGLVWFASQLGRF